MASMSNSKRVKKMYNSSTCIWPDGFNCKDCPNRSIEPNCHMTCKGYLAMKANQENSNKKRHEEVSYTNYYYDAKQRMQKCKNKKYRK